MANFDPYNKKNSTLSTLWITLLPVFIFIILLILGLFIIKSYYGDLDSHRSFSALPEGTEVQKFTLTNVENKKISLEDLDYKILVVNFWASWCHPCIVEIPSLVKLYNKFKDQGLKLIFINLDEKPEVMIPKILPPLGVNFESYYDHEQKLSELFNVSGVPLTVVLDSNNKVLFYEAG
jgi:thiol-disulfide isomerase/thioredoxin